MSREEIYNAVKDFSDKSDKDDFLLFIATNAEGDNYAQVMSCSQDSLHDHLMTLALQEVDVMDVILSIASIIEEKEFYKAETNEELKVLVQKEIKIELNKKKASQKFVN